MDEAPLSQSPPSSAWLEQTTVPAIRVRHLWHRFGKLDVLRDVSFEVGHGEIFGFIGPNGAGKTTTIRIMATLLEPIAGRVEVDGFDVSVDPEAVRKIIGYMPDHAGVYERVTVREYLEFFADAYRVAPDGNYSVVDAVMELTDLTKLSDKLVATMSKGMKQRLQLARTLLHDPKVLILDEPASDLDPRARIEIRDLLVELRSMGKTIFLSSHILTELADVCTSVAILERGRLVVAGPITDIARRLEEAAAERQRQQAPPAQMQVRQALPFAPPGPMQGPPPQGVGMQPQGTMASPGMQTAILPPQPQPQPNATYRQSAQEIEPAPQTVSVPRRRLKVRAFTQLEAVQNALTGVPNVYGVTPITSGLFLVTYVGDDQTIAAIVSALVAQNIAVAGVEPERNELERIFLEVTKGEMQ
jgi:ABC-2 type transport system ATP-binding protein